MGSEQVIGDYMSLIWPFLFFDLQSIAEVSASLRGILFSSVLLDDSAMSIVKKAMASFDELLYDEVFFVKMLESGLIPNGFAPFIYHYGKSSRSHILGYSWSKESEIEPTSEVLQEYSRRFMSNVLQCLRSNAKCFKHNLSDEEEWKSSTSPHRLDELSIASSSEYVFEKCSGKWKTMKIFPSDDAAINIILSVIFRNMKNIWVFVFRIMGKVRFLHTFVRSLSLVLRLLSIRYRFLFMWGGKKIRESDMYDIPRDIFMCMTYCERSNFVKKHYLVDHDMNELVPAIFQQKKINEDYPMCKFNKPSLRARRSYKKNSTFR